MARRFGGVSAFVVAAVCAGLTCSGVSAYESAADDLPSQGRSLFDALVSDESDGAVRYNVPFPYARLVAHIASASNSDASSTHQVLIPLGRSLQRGVAAPEYFKYPRVVTSFGGEAKVAGGVLAKDRIYLGYQEAAEVVEVISYNEVAGRFEFQVVRNYAEGETPSVRYANRALCLSCHQNDAPLFSRRLWSETNANPRVGALLARFRQSFHGVPARVGVDVAQAIDDATDRANLFSTWQSVWRDGCELSGPPERSYRCRADALTVAISHGLGADDAAAEESGRLTAALRETAPRLWPNGLVIASADISNRDPLVDVLRQVGSLPDAASGSAQARKLTNAIMRVNAIPSMFEPLRPRSPIARWNVSDADFMPRYAAGLGQFIASAELRELDEALLDTARRHQQYLRRLRIPCAFARAKRDGAQARISFECGAEDDGPHARGRIYMTRTHPVRAHLARLRLGGRSVVDLRAAVERMATPAQTQRLRLRPQRDADGLNVYMNSGEVPTALDLRWNASAGQKTWRGELDLSLIRTTPALRAAVDGIVARSESGASTALHRRAFSRRAVVGAALSALTGKRHGWCCGSKRQYPEMLRDEADNPLDGRGLPAIHATFVRHCGQCHRSEHTSPPNFLAGSEQQVDAKIGQCAARIYYRLSMWERSERERAKTPMPPVSALAARGVHARTWRASPELLAMTAHVRERLDRTRGNDERSNHTAVSGDYADLPPCLPSASR